MQAWLNLALVGFIFWLVLTFVPMPAVFKTVLGVMAALYVILRAIQMLGIAL